VDVRQPGVRRLCVAATVGPVGLLGMACRADGFERWFVESADAGRLELAFAPPGCDEPAAIGDLILVLRRLAAGASPGAARVTAAFHVGLTTVGEHGFGGSAVARICALVDEFAPPIPTQTAVTGRELAVVISGHLFEDLQDEGMPRSGWHYAAGSDAWLRVFEPFVIAAREPEKTGHPGSLRHPQVQDRLPDAR
jgi:hypothetical protein